MKQRFIFLYSYSLKTVMIRLVRWFFILMVSLIPIGILTAGIIIGLIYPKLPELDELKNYSPKLPLKIYTAEGTLISEFGEEKREVVDINTVPDLMKYAIIAAEDEHFYEHTGVDWTGVARAALSNVVARGAREGASTITMQVARNFYLTNEKTLLRKVSEILLAFKIEQNLSKDSILEIYMNQIYLGQQAYGFASASKIYYAKPMSKLSIAEAAMLAGLPKAPSRYNPVVNCDRANLRQHYVIKRMLTIGKITKDEFDIATKEADETKQKQCSNNHYALPPQVSQKAQINADYVAESVRLETMRLIESSVKRQYPDRSKEQQDAILRSYLSQGLKVYTTISQSLQDAANQAVWDNLIDYDARHGYRGPESTHNIPANLETVDDKEEALKEAFGNAKPINEFQPALVLSASSRQIRAYLRDGQEIKIAGPGLSFVRSAINRIRRGALIRVVQYEDDSWGVGQVPEVEAAFVAMNPKTGAVEALVGGFSFSKSKFNHATQAMRQPGSSFKPFIYSAALDWTNPRNDNDYITASTSFRDEPFTQGDWSPKNYDGSYSGPMRLRTALTRSKNLVSIRILDKISPAYALTHVSRFGFNPKNHPNNLTLALGSGAVTPLEMARAYSVFANEGRLPNAHLISRIEDNHGRILHKADEVTTPAIPPENAYIMTSIMQDVIKSGTATRAKSLGRDDLAGKTGTTNDQHDAWFAGYNQQLVGIAWMGFDQPRSLGEGESGGHTALPIWIDFMQKALKGMPRSYPDKPQGVVNIGGEYYYANKVHTVKRAPSPEEVFSNDSTEPINLDDAPPAEENAAGQSNNNNNAAPPENPAPAAEPNTEGGQNQ